MCAPPCKTGSQASFLEHAGLDICLQSTEETENQSLKERRALAITYFVFPKLQAPPVPYATRSSLSPICT